LNSGDEIEGKIIEQTDDYIRVDTGIGFYVTYYLDEIKTIEGKEGIISPKEVSQEDAIKQNKEIDDLRSSSDEEDTLPIAVSSSENMKKQIVAPKVQLDRKISYTSPRSQEDILFSEAQDPNAGKIEKKWEDNRYLDYQVERQVEKQKDNIKQVFISWKDSLLVQFQAYAQKFQKDNPVVYEKIMTASALVKDFLKQTQQTIKTVPLYVFIIAGSIFYVLFCYPLMVIGQKLGFKYPWMAWIPILQLFMMVRMSGGSIMSFILLFVPIIDIFVFIGIWGKIAEYLQKPAILSILMIIPGPNLLAIWYFALVKTK